MPALRANAADDAGHPGKNFVAPTDSYDYVKREVMIPMRDGVKLYTVIVVPKGAQRRADPADAHALQRRRPRQRARTRRTCCDILPQGDEVFVADGYIRVFQDIRGKYGSEGDYVMTRPLRGPLNNTKVDHSTDAYDTIDWLVKNVPEINGRVGMLGSSYEGFTVVMALVNPHPALKVAAPESPMVDGWMGDDWFHYGAFRQTNFDYFTGQTTEARRGRRRSRATAYDDYTNFLRAGSAGDYARAAGLDQLPCVAARSASTRPTTPSGSEQALDKVMAAQPLKVPTMWMQGLWDQEDMWGAIHSYAAIEPQGHAATTRTTWSWARGATARSTTTAASLGPLKWDGDTALQFRRDVLKPFFDQYLKDGAPKADTPPVLHLQHRREPLGPPRSAGR